MSHGPQNAWNLEKQIKVMMWQIDDAVMQQRHWYATTQKKQYGGKIKRKYEFDGWKYKHYLGLFGLNQRILWLVGHNIEDGIICCHSKDLSNCYILNH